jgi:hypothetical protein
MFLMKNIPKLNRLQRSIKLTNDTLNCTGSKKTLKITHFTFIYDGSRIL